MLSTTRWHSAVGNIGAVAVKSRAVGGKIAVQLAGSSSRTSVTHASRPRDKRSRDAPSQATPRRYEGSSVPSWRRCLYHRDSSMVWRRGFVANRRGHLPTPREYDQAPGGGERAAAAASR
jgi:hypothetical protein